MNRRTLAALALALAASLAVPAVAPAQEAAPDRGSKADRDEARLPPLAPLVAPQVDRIEAEVAGLARQRTDVPASGKDLHELRIDLRLLHRYLLAAARDAPAGSDLAAVAWLRSADLEDAVSAADALAGATPDGAAGDGPSRQQAEATIKLRGLTYALAEKPNVPAVDALARQSAESLSAVLGVPLPPGPMRPGTSGDEARSGKPADAAGGAGSAADPAARVEQLAGRARAIAVGQGLRRQLTELAASARFARQSASEPQAAAGAEQARADADDLADALAEAVDLADGLQRNTAVGPDARNQIESSLADALALYADPRTRSAGKRRMGDLRQYGRVVGRVSAMALSADDAARLAPVFARAREVPDESQPLLEAVEAYRRQVGRQAAREAPGDLTGSAVPPGSPLAATLARATPEMSGRAAAARASFLDDAGDVGGGGAFAVSPADLARSAERYREANDLADAALAAPAALATLETYGPLPTGGLERRLKVALAKSADPQATADERADAAASLSDARRLAGAASALAATDAGEVPAEVDAAYAGGRSAAFSTAWRDAVKQQASALASGESADADAIARLEKGADLVAVLRDAADLQASLDAASSLDRWADWGPSPTEVAAVLAPYRNAVSSAFAGFVAGRSEALDALPAVLDRHRPLVAWLRRSAERYGEPTAALPEGVAGTLGRLNTPSAGAPFEAERRASLLAALLLHYETDEAAASKLLDELVSAVGR